MAKICPSLKEDQYAPLASAEDAGSTGRVAIKRLTCKQRIKYVVNSSCFKVLGVFALVFAIFGGGIIILLDLPDVPTNEAMDYAMLSVMVFFIIELALRSVAEAEYLWSFFFWMDVLGTISMVFEVSFLLGAAGHMYTTNSGPNTAVVRTARAARIGARAGRLSKPLRVFSMMFRSKTVEPHEVGYSAKVLGTRLTQVFSSKVAMLTVVLTLGVPLFNIGRYPEDDFSMRLWGYKLEADYARDYHAYLKEPDRPVPGFFSASMEDMSIFYEELDYFPFRITGYGSEVMVNDKMISIPGASKLDEDRPPNRVQNIVKLEVGKCQVKRDGCENDENAAIYFDFRIANQYSAALDMAVVVFIITCMCLESCDLSFSINRMMVMPMERMLDTAHLMAKQLNQAMARGVKVQDTGSEMAQLTKSVRSYDDVDDADDEENAGDNPMNEIELLQGIFKKVVFLLQVFMEETTMEQHDIAGLDDESRGVMKDIDPTSGDPEADFTMSKRPSGSYSAPIPRMTTHQSSKSNIGQGVTAMSVFSTQELSVEPEVIESWSLNLIDMEPSDRHKVITWTVFDSEVGQATGLIWWNAPMFHKFYEAVQRHYHDNPYTSFIHGCDVLVSTYRILRDVTWNCWMGDLEASVLMITALGHDIGHPGRTNSFLVETAHKLALCYNDKSPLENMHCALLFEVIREHANIFESMDSAAYKVARSLMIDCVIHTDNSLHLELVKEIRKVYGTYSELCDATGKKFTEFSAQYIQDVLAPHSALWAKTILHMADISNPLHEYSMSKLWAYRVMVEFFNQGDEEKKLGIPVGMLNDREKVSTPSAQHGFITVLLAPLVLNVNLIFPPLQYLGGKMARNLQEWHKLWLQETNHKPEDIKKREEAIKKICEMGGRVGTSAITEGNILNHGSNIIDFSGFWTCTSTWGLSEFLKASKVLYIQRKAAENAPWPSWEFQQSGDHIVFVNHSALGHLREEFTVNGQTYHVTDGWKQKISITARWENRKLIVEKHGPQGRFREERHIDEMGRLNFTLQPLHPDLSHVRWGRVFMRKSQK